MRFLLLLGILFSCQSFSAQRAFRAHLNVGAVTSQISGDGLGGWDKFGLMGGGEVAVPLSEKWSFSGGIRYTQKGSRTKRDTINFNTFAYKLDYIDLPVKLLYSHRRNGEEFITFGAGISAGYLVRQRQMNNGAYYEINPPFSDFDYAAGFDVAVWFTSKTALCAGFWTSFMPTRPNPSVTNQFSYYERGNYNQLLSLALLFSLK
jgi:hypothetical protein